MNELTEYILDHTIRGACICGQCIDSVENPEEHQPEGHTIDMHFFKVAATRNPTKEEFLEALQNTKGNYNCESMIYLLDGKEHSYLQVGAEIGDQGLSFKLFALGELLGVWKVITPRRMMDDILDDDTLGKMAGSGLITIKTESSEDQ